MFSIEGLELEIGADWSDVALAFHQIEEATEDLRRDVARLSHAMTGATVAATGLATSAAAIGTAVAAGAAGAAGGFATIGIIASATKTDVQNTFKGLGQEISATFQSISGPIDEALTHVAAVASGLLGTLEGDFAEAFQVVAPWIETAANSLSRFAQVVMPAAISITKAAAPVVDALSRSMDHLAGGLAGFMQGLEQGMAGAATTAEAVFKSLSDVFVVLGDVMGRIAKASSTIGPAFASLFTELMTVTLRFLEGAIVPLMPEITAVVEGFTSFMQAIRESIGPVAAFTATVVPLLGLLAGLTSVISPVVAVVTALAGAAVTLHNNWSSITSFLQGEFPQAFGVARSVLGSFLAAGKEVFNALVSTARPVLRDLVEFVQSMLGQMERHLKVWGPAIEAVWSNVFEAFADTVGWYLGLAGKSIEVFLNVLSGDWKEAWEDLETLVRRTFGGAINFVIGAMADGLRAMAEFAKESLGKLYAVANALSAVSPAAKALSAGLRGTFATIDDFGASIVDRMKIDPEEGRKKGEDYGTSFAGGLQDALSSIFGGGGIGVPEGGVPNVGSLAASGLKGMEGLITEWPKSLKKRMEIAKRELSALQGMTPDTLQAMDPFAAMAKQFRVSIPKMTALMKEGGTQAVAEFMKMRKSWEQAIEQINKALERGLEKAVSTFAEGIGRMTAQAFGATTAEQDRIKEDIKATQAELSEAISEDSSEQAARLREKLAGLRDAYEEAGTSFKDVGRQVLEVLAGVMQQIGGILVAYGVTMDGFLKSGGFTNPWAAIGAGAALIAAGAALSAATRSANETIQGRGGGSTVAGRGGSPTGRGKSPYGREPIGGSSSGGGTLEARIEGTDLVFLLEETKRRQGR